MLRFNINTVKIKRWFTTTVLLLLLILPVLSPLTVPVRGAGGLYYTPITITERSGSTLTDYTIRIELNSTWDGWDHVLSGEKIVTYDSFHDLIGDYNHKGENIDKVVQYSGNIYFTYGVYGADSHVSCTGNTLESYQSTNSNPYGFATQALAFEGVITSVTVELNDTYVYIPNPTYTVAVIGVAFLYDDGTLVIVELKSSHGSSRPNDVIVLTNGTRVGKAPDANLDISDQAPVTINPSDYHDGMCVQAYFFVYAGMDNYYSGATARTTILRLEIKTLTQNIYFTDTNNNPLYYWIEEFDYLNKHAVIWVKVPSIPASSSTTIYMCYGGDNNPYSNYNDPSKTFLFYDDFSDGDASEWKALGASTSVSVVEIAGKKAMKVDRGTTTGANGWRYVEVEEPASFVFSCWVYDDDTSHNAAGGLAFAIDTGEPHSYYAGLEGSYSNYDYFRLYRIWKTSSYEKLINDGIDCPKNKWYKLEVIVYNNEITFNLYDEQGNLLHSNSVTDTAYTIEGKYIGVRQWRTHTYYTNFILRKYVEPEPKIVLGKSVCTVKVVSGTISVTVIGDGFEEVVENPVVVFNVSSRDDYGLKVFVDYVPSFFVADSHGSPLYYQVVDRGDDYVTLAVLLPFLVPGQETHLYIHYGSGRSGFSSFSTDLVNTSNVKLVDNVNVTVSVASVSPATQSKYVVAYIENAGSTDYYYLPVAINLDELGFTDWYGISHNDFRDLQAFYTQKEPVPVWTRCKMWYQLDNNSVIELSVEEGKYYLIPSDFDLVAYYWDGQEYVQIPTYRWDLDTSYIIFQSPVTGQVILRQEQVQGTLSTQDWFYLSFDDPYINITFSSPKWQPQTFYKDFYTVTENKTLTFDGTSVIATYNRTLAITKQQVTITVHTTSTFGASETYYAYLHAANMPEGWSAVIADEQGRATEGSSAYPDWWWSSSKSYVTLSYSIPDATTATVTTSSSIIYYAGLNLDGSDWLITINFTGSPHTYTVTDVCATREGNVMVASNGNVMVFVDDALSNTPIVRARDEPTIIWVVVPYIPADSYTSIVIGYGFDAAPYPDEWGALKVFPYTLINPVTDNFTRIQGSGTIKANMSFGNPLGSLEISSNNKTLFISEKTFFVDTDYLLVYADVYPADPADIIFGVADESGNIKSTYELTPSTGEWSTLTFPLLIEPNKKYRLVIGIEPVGTQATVYIDNIFVVPYTKNVRVVRLEGTYFSFPPISSPFKQIEQETPAGNMSINIGGGITEPVPENISMVAPYINVSSVPRVGDAGWQGIMAVSMWVAIGIAIARGSRNVYLGAALASAIMVIAGILLGDPRLTVTASIVFVVSYSLSWSRG